MMESKETAKLFDEDEEAEVPDFLNIENDYAKKYNDWRRKEELQRLKDKYGDRLDVMSEIEDNDEDGSGEEDEESLSETTEEEEDPFDEDFFKVYSALKGDDPKLYDKSFKFFDEKNEAKEEKTEEEVKKPKSKTDQEKTLTLPEYHRKLVEERKGITEEDEEQQAPPKTNNGYYQELSNIKDEIKNIVGDDDDDDEDDLFVVKATKEKVTSNNKEAKEKNKFISTFWSEKKKLDENEQFLKDYIVNQRYRDDERTLLDQARRMANVDSHFGGFDNPPDDDDDEEADDNEKIEKPSIDVAKFHFEEPDATTIKRFPRNLTSVRDAIKPAVSKRAEARERKRKEKETELKRLRRFKREEMETKLAKLKETAGIDAPLDLKTLDLNIIVDDDEEFDPDKYDEKMKLLFGDQYYHEKEEKAKPKFDYFPEIDDDLYDEQTDVMLTKEPDDDEQEGTTTKKSKKKTKKEIKRSKDIMADDDIGIYEDIVGGDLATRFRYRMVEPNDFGLTDEEILLADDKELNQWVSLKKMSQYRPKHFEEYDRKVYQRKGADMELKKKILKSVYGDHAGKTMNTNNEDHEQDQEEQEGQPKKKTKKGKKRRKSKAVQGAPAAQFKVTEMSETTTAAEKDGQGPEPQHQQPQPQQQQQQQKNGTKRKRKHKKNAQPGGAGRQNAKEDKGEIDRLKAYGMSKREIKRLKTKM